MHELILALIPTLIMLGFKFFHPYGSDLTLPEFAISAVLCVGLGFGMVAVGKHAQSLDVELWNGEVTGKTFDIEYYKRAYSCNCRTVNKVTTCQTCYRKGHDMTWDVQTNIGNFNIDREDCRSTIKAVCLSRYSAPPFWEDVQKGDPVSRQNSYTNYVKAVDNSLFKSVPVDDQNRVKNITYPIAVYDFYNVDRVVLDGVKLPESRPVWNRGLANMLKTVGPQRQANVVLVLTSVAERMYGDMLIAQWEGANKNDIVIIAGFPKGDTTDAPSWVKVHSWAKKDIMNVEMRDELISKPELWQSANQFFPAVEKIIMDKFERRPMAEFEYLKHEIELSGLQLILFSILSAILGIGLSIFLIKFDVLGGMNQTRRY